MKIAVALRQGIPGQFGGYSGYTCDVTVFNNNCDQIGGGGGIQGQSLDSQLPYTIDFTTIDGSNIDFDYAGFGWTADACSQVQLNNKWYDQCMAQFLCGPLDPIIHS